jgi:hypothetical protein
MTRLTGFGGAVCALLLALVPSAWSADNATYRAWIEAMKEADRGPFAHIRWFCNDGEILPPEAYACSEHGGGHQHGEWSEHTRTLRDNGFLVATFLAGVDGEAFLAAPDARDAWAQLVIEKFLVGADDGWILRNALC